VGKVVNLSKWMKTFGGSGQSGTGYTNNSGFLG
jgi:hypothetical protein